MKKYLICCLIALLALLTVGTAFAADGIIFRDCPICGEETQFKRVRYGGNFYINNVPSHVGYYKCSVGHGEELAHLDDNEPHRGGTATCTTQKKCEVCGTSYGDLLQHDTVAVEAKAATCTEIGWDAYEYCKDCDYTTYQEIPATGHSYTKKKVVKPTCEKNGYTEYTCDACGDQYTGQHKSKLLHWFDAWTGNGDGTHSAACKRDGCDHIGKTDCAMQEIKLGDATIAYCPICGDTQDGKTFALIEGAQAKALTKRLPQGEPALRTLAWTDDATLLSVDFEYAGKLTQPTGMVEFTLPAALIEGKTLSTLNADGTQEALACTIDGDTAAFTLDFTDSEVPIQLIQITPAA